MIVSGDQAMVADVVPQRAADRQTREKRYLFGPVTDFFCRGGIYLPLLPFIYLLPASEFTPAVAAITLGISHFINHPHFAFSYQIFYEGFGRKAFGSDNDAALRMRYIFAGIVCPVALAAFLAYGLISGDVRNLGLGANLMTLLVGWHYVKQGYGMLMVDAALKRQYFDETEKKVLLVNAYAVWALSWLATNAYLSERSLWHIHYYMFHVPETVVALAFCVAVATSAATVMMLIKKWRANGASLPINGVVAYIASLYLWALLMRLNVLALLIVPALHSLQYLVVVARYQINRERGRSDVVEQPSAAILNRLFGGSLRLRLAGFVALGGMLGYLGFWGVPEILQAVVPYEEAVFGPSVFLFMVWIFINVHHYLLDNVMWRSQNPDVRKYLFA